MIIPIALAEPSAFVNRTGFGRGSVCTWLRRTNSSLKKMVLAPESTIAWVTMLRFRPVSLTGMQKCCLSSR